MLQAAVFGSVHAHQRLQELLCVLVCRPSSRLLLHLQPYPVVATNLSASNHSSQAKGGCLWPRLTLDLVRREAHLDRANRRGQEVHIRWARTNRWSRREGPSHRRQTLRHASHARRGIPPVVKSNPQNCSKDIRQHIACVLTGRQLPAAPSA